jgi:hypothetical protein
VPGHGSPNVELVAETDPDDLPTNVLAIRFLEVGAWHEPTEKELPLSIGVPKLANSTLVNAIPFWADIDNVVPSWTVAFIDPAGATETEAPYTARTVSNSLPFVFRVTNFVVGDEYLNHIDFSPAPSACTGSPISTVAAELLE